MSSEGTTEASKRARPCVRGLRSIAITVAKTEERCLRALSELGRSRLGQSAEPTSTRPLSRGPRLLPVQRGRLGNDNKPRSRRVRDLRPLSAMLSILSIVASGYGSPAPPTGWVRWPISLLGLHRSHQNTKPFGIDVVQIIHRERPAEPRYPGLAMGY